MMVALHAAKSARSALAWRSEHPDRLLVVALTGTDLHRDLDRSAQARAACDAADALVALHEGAPSLLRDSWAAKTAVIHQSALPPARRARPRDGCFEVCVLSHLRGVKDPLLPAQAVRLLPDASRIKVIHAGAALDAALERLARRETADNPRWSWVGELPRWRAQRLLARSRLLVVPSLLEGGANVVSEALACGVPVLATDVAGSKGLLGEDYPGLFAVGDAPALAVLLERCESDSSLLAAACNRRRHLVDPAREASAWTTLLQSMI